MEPQRSVPIIAVSEVKDQGLPSNDSFLSISSTSEDGDKKDTNTGHFRQATTGTVVQTNSEIVEKSTNEKINSIGATDDKAVNINLDQIGGESTNADEDKEILVLSHEGKIFQENMPETDTPRNNKRIRADAFNESSILEMLSDKSKSSDEKSSYSSTTEPLTKVPRVDPIILDGSEEEEKKKDGHVSEDSSFDGESGPSIIGKKMESTKGPTGKTPSAVRKRSSTSLTSSHQNANIPECDEYYLSLVKLDPIPSAPPLPHLTPTEVYKLEVALQIGPKFSDHSDDVAWRSDWTGNLQLLEKDLIVNRDVLETKPFSKKNTMTFLEWVAKYARHPDDFSNIRLLFSYVYNMPDTPPMAKRILAHYIQQPVSSILERMKLIQEAVQRISYDPIVLKQDGWTTAKVDLPNSATGGAFMIGRRILWQRSPAVVIAFIKDLDLGDLWKCMWTEDLDTFDLEADELQEGIKRWERKVAREKGNNKSDKNIKPSSSTRFEQSRNFTVKGIEDGIILATSYKAKSGRPWPARIMHVAEVKSLGQLTSRRSSSKNEIHVVFLAPYWNNQAVRSTNADSTYSSGPLFELETIDVSENTIQEYPYNIKDGILSIDKLRTAFGFLGLPKSAFSRYLNSHRIAMALKAYANKANSKTVENSSNIDALCSMTDTHPLSGKTFLFPEALLHLPFEYTLQKYPNPLDIENVTKIEDDDNENSEPIMKLSQMLDSLCPPQCWSDAPSSKSNTQREMLSPLRDELKILTKSPEKIRLPKTGVSVADTSFNLKQFCSQFVSNVLDGEISKIPLQIMKRNLEDLVSHLNLSIAEVESFSTLSERQAKLRAFLLHCLLTKAQCEDIVNGPLFLSEIHLRTFVSELRKTCERIYKKAMVRMGHINAGNGITAVLTDSRCNQHITARGSYERAVRLPAAIRGAKNAGAGSKPSMPLITKIEETYIDQAEHKIIPMAHKTSYLNRLKKKIASFSLDAKGESLTDDSDGEGGEDTKGSRGSYAAAVTGVAAALKAVDMVVGGSCVNSFCAIRPPGHHAGRELRPMNAISNGFCLLNAAACAALYATSPVSEGGLGLKRVCVVDIDVHHGNGTQDILASTYDPRFLYISTHAGGPHINGYSEDRSEDEGHRNLNTKDGIFPGRCGDISPHQGVLNLPLGQKITPSALGTALVCQVTPAIEKFAPELIIISAGFDAHKNDPLGLGGLSSNDFGTVTKVICDVAKKICSGRVISILEGGYGVPCCRPLDQDLFLPSTYTDEISKRPMKLLKLGDDLPENMEDPMDYFLLQKLDKCYQEGFIDCVKEHVSNLSLSSDIDTTL